MANLGGFDAGTVEPMQDFDPIPAGKYVAVITNSEVKPNKAATGTYLELTFQVLDGQYKGRMVWARLNLENPNELTVKIARSELAAICKAVNIMQPKDSVELHNLPLVINVKLKKREDSGEPGNEIKGYSKREQAAPKNAASKGIAPWKK